ncbi:MAG: sigma-70 family RNA polymerase sigma factor [Polyangiales bacterium]
MTPSELDDLTLERARRGDRDACRAFVVRYQGIVFHTASRVLGRAAPELEDVAQDAMLKCLDALPGFDPKGSAKLSTWIATITARTAIDALRARRVVVPLDALRDVRAAQHSEPDAALGDAQERARLAKAMEGIGPDQRAVMVLRVEHDLGLDEIARALKIEVGTVKSRLARAKQALLAALGERPAREHDHG